MGNYLCIASNNVPPSVSKQIKVSVDCEYSQTLQSSLFPLLPSSQKQILYFSKIEHSYSRTRFVFGNPRGVSASSRLSYKSLTIIFWDRAFYSWFGYLFFAIENKLYYELLIRIKFFLSLMIRTKNIYGINQLIVFIILLSKLNNYWLLINVYLSSPGSRY